MVTAAPAASRASASAAPVVTPMPDMPAAALATMSHVESPTYQQRAGVALSWAAAYSSRSGAGLACSTWLPSTMVGSDGSFSDRTEAMTWPGRLDVAMANVM